MEGGKGGREGSLLTGIRVEIASGATEDEVALAVALPGLDEREVPSDSFFHDVVPALREGERGRGEGG